MMQNNNLPNLLEILLARQTITFHSLQLIQDFCSRWKVSAYEAVLETNLVTENELSEILASHLGIDRYLEIESEELKFQVEEVLPYSHAKRYSCIPIQFLDDGLKTLKVVLADPTNQEHLNALASHTKKNLVLAVANQTTIIRKIHELYPPEAQFGAVGKPE